MSVPRPAGSLGLVVAWMSGALASFVFSALAVRVMTSHLNVFEIGAARTALGLALLLVFLAAKPALGQQIVLRRSWSHLPRNVVHALGGIAWTFAIAALPFATVFSIEFTAPAWVALLAFPILGERVKPSAWVGIGMCILGVLVILRPGAATFDANVLFALSAAFCFALSILLTRRLALTQSVFAIMFWMMIWQLLFYSGAIVMTGGHGFARSEWPVELILALPVLGIAGLGSQFCLAKALQIGEAATVVPLDFLRVPIIALIGWAAFGEALSVWVFSGAAIIMAGIAYGLLPPSARSQPAKVCGLGALPADVP